MKHCIFSDKTYQSTLRLPLRTCDRDTAITTTLAVHWYKLQSLMSESTCSSDNLTRYLRHRIQHLRWPNESLLIISALACIGLANQEYCIRVRGQKWKLVKLSYRSHGEQAGSHVRSASTLSAGHALHSTILHRRTSSGESKLL